MSRNPLWFTLDDWSLMAVTGPQAQAFLQGQVTCDIRELKPGESRLGAHCTPKGRMQFSFRVLAVSEERFLLRVPTSMVPAVKESLGKYILFSKADLTDESPQYSVYGFYGEQARAAISEHIATPPETPGQWVTGAEGSVVLMLGEGRYECWLPPQAERALGNALGEPAEGNTLWRLLDIRDGLGEVWPQTREQFTPQSLNFPQVGAVSFRKGCYTGQEIVARLHYKGKLKNHMRRLIASEFGSKPWEPGQTVRTAEGKKVGEVITAASGNEGTMECLAVLDDNALEEVLTVEDSSARVGTLPYTVG